MGSSTAEQLRAIDQRLNAGLAGSTLTSSDITTALGYTPAAPAKLYRHLAGFEPDKLSTNVLNINPGSCANSDATKLYAASSLFAIDMSTTGAGGLDTGSPTNGVGYYPYLIADASGNVDAVISSSTTYGGVTVPAGYSLVRKLPFGFIYNSAWDGIPDFHLTHWPMPFIRFTGAESTSTWRALASGAAAAWADVDLSSFIPDNARIAYLHCRVETPAAATPGLAYLRVLGSQATGLELGNPAAGFNAYLDVWQRVTSVRKVQYQVTNGTKLTLRVLGFGMTEPV